MSPEPITLDEKRKRDAVLAALKDCAQKGKLGVCAAIYGIAEYKLFKCAQDNSLGTLTQSEIDWLAVDLRE